jgi:hypothetical protein
MQTFTEFEAGGSLIALSINDTQVLFPALLARR